MSEDGEKRQVQLNITPEVARGAYSNFAEIKHAKEEFCLDFYNVFPPIGAMVGRIMVSPGHLKRIIRALSQNLDKYERQFGPVQEAEPPDSPFNSGQKQQKK